MLHRAITFIGIIALFSAFVVPEFAWAKEQTYTFGDKVKTQEFRFTNANWDELLHPKVAEFTVRADGSAYGTTETGVPFVQYNIPSPRGMRIQRFEIQDHYHYIVDGDIAYTFAELSIRLAQAKRNSRDV
jgi:hypothetical protein